MAVVTRTIRAAGGDYTSYAAWNAAEQTDLVAAGDTHVCEYERVDGGGDSVHIQINGWTADANNYISLTVPPAFRHDGTRQSGAYLQLSSNSAAVLSLSVPYTRAAWLDVTNVANGHVFYLDGTYGDIQKCLACAGGSGRVNYRFMADDCRAINSLACDFGIGFDAINYTKGNWLNCNAVNLATGFRTGNNAAGSSIVKNCVSYNNTIAYQDDGGGWDPASTHNATSSATDDAPGDNSVIDVDETDFTDAVNDDFHVSGLGSRLYAAAIDLSSDFTDDIDGDTRLQWDIGFDEFVGGVAPIELDADDLDHAHPLDSAAVLASFTLQVDALGHASTIDACDVVISEAVSLLIDQLAHGSSLDEPLITPTYTLLPQALAHAHPLDECAAYWRVDLLANGLAHISRIDTVDVQAAPEIVIDVDSMIHGHAVDAIALEYETTFIVDGLRHDHPVDAPDVSALLGLLTTLRRNDTTWRINAGQSVDNAAGVDGLWHVIEAIFDGAGSILSIDGAPVAGNAGVRELNSLTLGAELDGGERLTGDVGELRIYNGALTQTQRDKIRAELQGKWL